MGKVSLIKNDSPEHEKNNITTSSVILFISYSGLLNSGSSFYTNSKFNKTNCCVFCEKDDHKPQNCEIISKIEDRKSILKRSGRCFLCLRKGHMIRNCPAKFSCFNCKRRHHMTTCDKLKAELS